MSNEKRTKQRQRIEDQLQGWDLAGKTEESAMSYIAYREAKSWHRDEFFDSGAREVEGYTAEFFKKMNFRNPLFPTKFSSDIWQVWLSSSAS